MSSLTSAASRTTVLRGSTASAATPARIDADLRANPYAHASTVDPRLVDPTLAKAFDDAAGIERERARQEGLQLGYAEGLAAARRDTEAAFAQAQARAEEAELGRRTAVEQATAALHAAARALSEREIAGLRGVEDLILQAAYELATVLVGHELASAQAPARDAVRRALTMLPDDGPVTVFVNPADLETLHTLNTLNIPAEFVDRDDSRVVRLLAHPDVEPGGCIADAGPTHVDASVSAALQRVQEVLTP